MTSMKTAVVDYLTDVVLAAPATADIRVIGSVRQLDQLDNRPVLIVKTDSYEKLPAAPQTKRLAHFTATLVSPHVDPERAEADLDDRLEVLLPLLLTSGLNWTDATQAAYDETHICYDIKLDSILTPEV